MSSLLKWYFIPFGEHVASHWASHISGIFFFLEKWMHALVGKLCVSKHWLFLHLSCQEWFHLFISTIRTEIGTPPIPSPDPLIEFSFAINLQIQWLTLPSTKINTSYLSSPHSQGQNLCCPHLKGSLKNILEAVGGGKSWICWSHLAFPHWLQWSQDFVPQLWWTGGFPYPFCPQGSGLSQMYGSLYSLLCSLFITFAYTLKALTQQRS